MWLPQKRRCACALVVAIVAAAATAKTAGESTSAGGSLVLRVRMPSGAVKRIKATPKDTVGDLVGKIDGNGSEGVQGLGTSAEGDGVAEATQSIARLGLRNGDFLYARATNGDAAVAARAQAKADALRVRAAEEASAAAAREFSPFPDLARPPRPRLSKRGMGLAELQAIRDQTFKVVPQKEANVKKASVVFAAFADWTAYARALPEGQQRSALMFGTVDEKARMVKVEALFEVPSSQKPPPPSALAAPSGSATAFGGAALIDGLPDPAFYAEASKDIATAGSAALAEPCDPATKSSALPPAAGRTSAVGDVERACHIASLLGLRPVGWCVVHDKRKHFLSAAEVVTAAQLQAWAMRSFGRAAGALQVTATVPVDRAADTAATEVYTVSNQTVQMMHERVVEVHQPSPAGDRLLMTEPVSDDGKEVTEVDTLGLVNAVAVIQHKGFLRTAFPRRKTAGAGANDDDGNEAAAAAELLALRKCLFAKRDDSTSAFLRRLADFRLLLYVSQQVGLSDDFARLCRCVRSGDAADPVVGKYKLVLETLCAGDGG